jgi:hypothetical protein
LKGTARDLEIGDLVVDTIVWEHAKQLRSYDLSAEAFGLNKKMI